jgi:hypothetical protein
MASPFKPFTFQLWLVILLLFAYVGITLACTPTHAVGRTRDKRRDAECSCVACDAWLVVRGL